MVGGSPFVVDIQVPAWILGKMTSALQITGTGFARPLKVCAIEAKARMRQNLKAVAAQTGAVEAFKCRPFELLTIIHESLRQLTVSTVEKNLVLAEGMRNGHLAYRPNWSTNLLEPVEGQPWRSELPKLAESHRLHPDWAVNRLSWRSADGVPELPVYQTKTCKGLEDFADNAAVAGPHEVKVHAGEDDKGGEPTIEGPCNKVAGTAFEEEQLCLGVFTGFDDSVKEDFIAMGLKQICARNRLNEMQVTDLLSCQKPLCRRMRS